MKEPRWSWWTEEMMSDTALPLVIVVFAELLDYFQPLGLLSGDRLMQIAILVVVSTSMYDIHYRGSQR